MPSLIFRRERKSGTRWTVRFPTGEVDEEGKPVLHIKTFRYLREAKDHVKTLEDAKAANKPINESDQTLSRFLKEYLEATDLRETTRASYRETAKAYIEPQLGKVALRDITPSKVQRLYTELRKTLSPRTVRYVHSILHSALDHAVALRLIRANPSKGVKLPKQSGVAINYLRGQEISAFLAAADSEMYGAIFEFMLATGVRPGEARAVMWSDIDFDAGTVQIQRTISDSKPFLFNEPKTAKGKRILGLPAKTLDLLVAHKAEQGKKRVKLGDRWQDNGLVFCGRKGEPIDRRNLANKHLKPLLEGLAKQLYPAKGAEYERLRACNLYSLRHTHATRLIESGVNLKTVSEQLGHKDVAFTIQTYVHSTPAMQQAAVDEISKALYS